MLGHDKPSAFLQSLWVVARVGGDAELLLPLREDPAQPSLAASAPVPDELVARAFWQSYTAGNLRLAPPPLARIEPAATATDQAPIRRLHP